MAKGMGMRAETGTGEVLGRAACPRDVKFTVHDADKSEAVRCDKHEAMRFSALGVHFIFLIIAPPLFWWLFLQIWTRTGPRPENVTGCVLCLVLPVVWSCGMRWCTPKSCSRKLCASCSILALLISMAVTLGLTLPFFFTEAVAPLPSLYVPGQRVAVIGGGASGTMATWLLRQDNRSAVHMYEASPHIGGHAATEYIDGKHLDMGFIFSTPVYSLYNALCDKYGSPRKVSRLTAAFGGDEAKGWLPYDNIVGGAGEVFREAARKNGDGPERAERLEAEMAKFMEMSKKEVTLETAIVPLWAFLWWHGFSEDFTQSVLVPMLTVLFVTGHGAVQQSAGMTLEYFRKGSPLSFLTLNGSDPNSPEVRHTIGGVKYVYERMLKDVNATIAPRFEDGKDVFLNTPVRAVVQVGDKWRVDIIGGGEGLIYDKVVFACDAHTQAKLLKAGNYGDQIVPWMLELIDYDDLNVTITDVPQGHPLRTSALYIIHEGGLLGGSIDRILGNGPGDFRLQGIPPKTPQRVIDSLDLGRVRASRWWSHTRWTVWQILLVMRFVRRVNYRNNLIMAGAWVEGVGHNDALRAGAMAVCAVGVSDSTREMFRELVGDWPQYCDPTKPIEGGSASSLTQ